MHETSLAITGHGNQPVPNRLFQQEGAVDHLAIMLPGLGYTCDMPLFYFIVSHLLDQGTEVLQVAYDYAHNPTYHGMVAAERQAWLIADATAACRAGLARRPYRRITLVGKSLGTRAMAHLLNTEAGLRQAATVWLTPTWKEQPVQTCLL